MAARDRFAHTSHDMFSGLGSVLAAALLFRLLQEPLRLWVLLHYGLVGDHLHQGSGTIISGSLLLPRRNDHRLVPRLAIFPVLTAQASHQLARPIPGQAPN